MFVDVFFCASDDRWFRVFVLNNDLVAEDGEVLSKNGQQFDDGIVLLRRDDALNRGYRRDALRNVWQSR